MGLHSRGPHFLWRAVAHCETEVCLGTWCFKPTPPLRIISGLKKAFIHRYLVERTDKTGIKSEEQSERAESRRENI